MLFFCSPIPNPFHLQRPSKWATSNISWQPQTGTVIADSGLNTRTRTLHLIYIPPHSNAQELRLWSEAVHITQDWTGNTFSLFAWLRKCSIFSLYLTEEVHYIPSLYMARKEHCTFSLYWKGNSALYALYTLLVVWSTLFAYQRRLEGESIISLSLFGWKSTL